METLIQQMRQELLVPQVTNTSSVATAVLPPPVSCGFRQAKVQVVPASVTLPVEALPLPAQFDQTAKFYLSEQEHLDDLQAMLSHYAPAGDIPLITTQTPLVLKDFLVQTVQQAPTLQIQEHDACDKCQSRVILKAELALLVCTNCAHAVKYMDTTSANMVYGEEMEFSHYTYQRTNYFSEYLSVFQAKESYQVPTTDLQLIMKNLWHWHGIRQVKDITIELVRKTIRKSKLKHLYKHNTQVWCRITGQAPPRLSTELEARAKLMFKSLLPCFEKHAPPTRKNLFSYSLVCYKILQLLGQHHLLHHFPLLKETSKVKQMDETWRLICADLGWQFQSSI